MTNEIRDYGDKKTIVVYTDDNTILRRLREWKSCQKLVFYEVWRNGDPRKAVNVAADLYFNCREEGRIRKALGMPLKVGKRSGAQQEQTERMTKTGRRFRFSSGGVRQTENADVFTVKN